MKKLKKKNVLFLAVLAIAFVAIGLLFYAANQKVAIEMPVVSQVVTDQVVTDQGAGTIPIGQNDGTVTPWPAMAATPIKAATAVGNQIIVQDFEQQCPEFYISNENGGDVSMKTVELIRAKETGIYLFPLGVTIDQVADIKLNGQPVPLDRFRAIDGDGIDVFDSDPDDPNEVVTVEVEV